MNALNTMCAEPVNMDIGGIKSSYLMVALFFLLSGGMILLTGGEVEKSALARVIWLLVYGSAIGYGFNIFKPLMSCIRVAPGFMVLAMLCLCSIGWSSAQSITIAYSVAIFGSTLVAYLMLAKVEPFRLLQYAATAMLVLILINGLLLPLILKDDSSRILPSATLERNVAISTSI